MPIELPPPLLRRTQLYPGESLTSLLIRLSELNLYGSPNTVIYMCKARLQGTLDNVCNPHHAETYEIISALTGLPVASLYNATYHFFENALRLPDEPRDNLVLPDGESRYLLSTPVASRQLRTPNAAAYCPECLNKMAYHRQAWLPFGVNVCLTHKCILVDRCQECGQRLLISDLIRGRCPDCRADLTHAQTTPVDRDSFGLFTAQVVQFWLGLSAPPTDMMGIPDEPPFVLHRVLDGFRACVLSRIKSLDQGYVHPNPPIAIVPTRAKSSVGVAENYVLLTTAMKALIHWPLGFNEFLHVYDPGPCGTAVAVNRTLYGSFGLFYASWLCRRWSSSSFDFVRQAFDKLLLSGQVVFASAIKSKRFRDKLYETWTYISITEAARQLGVSLATLERLIAIGSLRLLDMGISRPHNVKLLFRQEVDTLRKVWSKALSLADAAAFLGLSEELTTGLAESRVVSTLRGPLSDGSAHWAFSKKILEQFQRYLLRNAVQIPDRNSSDFVDLTTAAKMAAVIGGDAIEILKWVCHGLLPVYTGSRDGVPSVGNLAFKAGDIRKAIRAIKESNGWYSVQDIARMMQVKDIAVARWIDNDLLHPIVIHGSSRYFGKVDVEKFVSDHLFSEQAAQILEVGLLTVQKWAREGRLKTVSGPSIDGCHRHLFRREDVERLRKEKRLTAPQIAKRLGISRSQLGEWIRKGKIKPVSGPNIDSCRHYLFVCDEL